MASGHGIRLGPSLASDGLQLADDASLGDAVGVGVLELGVESFEDEESLIQRPRKRGDALEGIIMASHHGG